MNLYDSNVRLAVLARENGARNVLRFLDDEARRVHVDAILATYAEYCMEAMMSSDGLMRGGDLLFNSFGPMRLAQRRAEFDDACAQARSANRLASRDGKILHRLHYPRSNAGRVPDASFPAHMKGNNESSHA